MPRFLSLVKKSDRKLCPKQIFEMTVNDFRKRSTTISFL